MPSIIRVTAPAKLNLFLHVTGKRIDGYHLLQSFVVFTQFSDVLDIKKADELHLRIEGEYAGALQSDGNLVLRAGALLQARYGCSAGAAMTLHKHIPVGAGLGGGSANAAAALRGLIRLWGLDVTETALHAMAIELGSDVPVCLYSRPSWVEGAGEKIRPVEVAISLWVILINPRITLLTGDVFNAFSGKYTTQMPLFNTIATPELLLEQLQMTHNSLQPTACALAPEISVVLAAIAALPGCQMARMSGSGATCFGLFLTQAEAVQAKQQLHAVHPQWWCVATPLWESDRETQ